MSINKKNHVDFLQKRGKFSMVPNEIWETVDLDHIGKFIWMYILSQDPNWSSSRNNIARNLGIAKDTVTKYINLLIKLNMLKISVSGRHSWDFEIMPPDHWTKIRPDQNQASQLTGPTVGPLPDQNQASQVAPLDQRLVHTQNNTQKDNKGDAGVSFLEEEDEIQNQPITAREPVKQEAPASTKSIKLSFKDMVVKFNSENPKAKSSEYVYLVQNCKEMGLTRDDMSASVFVQVIMGMLTPRPGFTLAQIKSMKERAAQNFEKAVVETYLDFQFKEVKFVERPKRKKWDEKTPEEKKDSWLKTLHKWDRLDEEEGIL
jgi:hypothetical protein